MAKVIKKKDDDVKPAKKTTAAKKAVAKPGQKASARKKKESEVEGIRKAEAAVRTEQEEGSIAPPTSNLVSAFALFKKKKPQTSTPTVTRLAAGGSLPRPPAPKPVEEKPLVSPPSAAAPMAAQPPAPPVAPVKPSTAAPAKPATVVPISPAKPPLPPAPVARPAARPAAPPPYYRRPAPPPHRAPHPHAKAAHKAAPGVPSPQAASGAPDGSAAKPALRPLEVSSMVTVRELAEKMEVKPNDVIKKLMSLGIFATINQRLEQEAASIVASDFGFELKVVAMYKEEELQVQSAQKEDKAKLKARPPVVTIMGHVDHGKTSLLDAIRSARVAEGESGGITQHIGAYQVKTPKGLITFLDTPGHEAFTAMRARGAKVTDIVILVVSATDGVMPQTIEAIDHSKAAGVPIVVAVNKIDLPGANPQKMRQDLAGNGLQPEEWGGKTIFQDVSAKKRLNLDKLLDMIHLQAEILELKANPDRPGYGVILEARMDPKRGSVATLLVQAGTVKVGDAFVSGLCYGKIKALVDDQGNRVEQAGPSTPVEILGIMGTPQAGDAFTAVSDDRQARDIAEKRQLLAREQQLAHQRHMTLVGLKSQIGAATAKDLNIVLKADVQGSLQALRDSLEGLSTAECRVRTIHSGIGNLNESDVLLASASDAVALLFHSSVEPRAQELAAREGVEVRKYEIIYDLIGDVKAALEGLLAPEIVDVVVGKGEIREVFPLKGGGKVAGSFVRDGKVVRGGLVKVVRGAAAVFEGKISSLKRFKDDVKEVEKNLECGITFEGFNDFQKGDQLEFIVKESRTRRLSQAQPQ